MEFLRGRDGKDGKDGKDGQKGDPGESIMGPPGKPGKDGRDGNDGKTEIKHVFQDLPPDLVTGAALADLKKKIDKELEMLKIGSMAGGGGSASVEQTNDLQRQIDELAMGIKYDKLIDTVGNLTYIGEATPGSATSAAVWRIKRVDDKGADDLDIRWADGTADFTKVWDDRATFTY
jgi:hypothetical protein